MHDSLNWKKQTRKKFHTNFLANKNGKKDGKTAYFKCENYWQSFCVAGFM